MTADRGPVTKLVLSGKADRFQGSPMTIQAWGRCSPTDCEWGEVPFFMLYSDQSPRKYVRGFATWDFEVRTINVIVTFERTGLKIDSITIEKEPGRTHVSFVETMTRINY